MSFCFALFALSVALVAAVDECDGETTRTCEECVALTERLTHCNYCKADKKCNGDTDFASCTGGSVGDVAGCAATPTPSPVPGSTPVPECDGETTRTCGECVGLTEGGFKCNYCKADKRCNGNFDFGIAKCDGGFVGDAAACDAAPGAPTPAGSGPECDGETTRTCEQCVALSELGTKCDFCKSDNRCNGDIDKAFSAGCAGGWAGDVASCTAAPTSTPVPECDGETSRTCEECVALKELGTQCNFCKTDGRCQGDLDLATAFSCKDENGYATSMTGCAKPIKAPICDGEITTCEECAAKSEFVGKCNWCPDTGACYGNLDKQSFDKTCNSTTIDVCTNVTSDPTFKFDCSPCTSDCAAGCNKVFSNGLSFCLKAELQILGGSCKTKASPDGCCPAGATSAPVPAGSLRPGFSTICTAYRAGCENAADFCSYKAKYLSCATRSDRCGDFNTISADFDRLCPAIKCACSPVKESCLADRSAVAVTCTAPGMVQNQVGTTGPAGANTTKTGSAASLVVSSIVAIVAIVFMV